MSRTNENALDIYINKLDFLIAKVNEEENVERIINELPKPKDHHFEDLMAQFVELSDQVLDSLKQNVYSHSIKSLKPLIEKILEITPDFFGDFRCYKDLYFTIIDKIEESIEESIEADLSEISCEQNFKLLNISEIEEKSYFYKSKEQQNLFLIISLDHVEDTDEVLNETDFEMMFYILKSFNFDQKPQSKRLCLINEDNALYEESCINEIKMNSIINLEKVSQGEIIHKEFRYTDSPAFNSQAEWNLNKEYQQFNDALYILSEYNEQKNILDKYLKLYQLIENFMYRNSICKLINGSDPNLFSIRQFQNLFKNIEGKEIDALKGFINSIFKENYDNKSTFKDLIFKKWVDFIGQSNSLQVEESLRQLGIQREVANINEGNFKNFLSELVYKLRNSIVHNKETEFHLSSGNLYNYPGFQLILKDYLLTTLEETLYHLILNDNDIVWYDKASLKLYS